MDRFLKTVRDVAGFCLIGLTAAAADSVPARQSFDIVTGPAAGNYFAMGEAMARVVSHPPGLGRCEKTGVCGPAGVIVSARTSDGAVANVLDVNSGAAASGLVLSNLVGDAVAGRGAFAKLGPQTHIKVMAFVDPETMQLVVPAGSRIRSVADLKGKRVSLGDAASGSDVIAAAVLSAYGVKNVRIRREGFEASGGLMRDGRLDAFFFLGRAPAPLIRDLVERLHARLIPIGGAGRARLIARVKSLAPDVIAAGVYRGSGAVETVRCDTLWIVRDSASEQAVYGLVRSLYDPSNRALLGDDAAPTSPMAVGLLPLHPGAARYYRETGQWPIPAKSR